MILSLVYAAAFFFIGRAISKNKELALWIRIVGSIFAYLISFIVNLVILAALTDGNIQPPVGVFTWFSAVAFFFGTRLNKGADTSNEKTKK